MHRQQGSKWSDLPQELVILAIGKLVTSAGNDFCAAASMRRVCKAWRAASSQYSADLSCRSMDDLSKLCPLFPQMKSIFIRSSPCEAVGLRPLSFCTQLTSITVDGTITGLDQPKVLRQAHFGHLPQSLRALSLANLVPHSSSIVGHLPCVTYVRLSANDLSRESQINLLQQLPNLEELVLDRYGGPDLIASQHVLSRLSGLTRLEFRGPSADDEFPACEDLCLLKELKIWDAMVEPSWVETLLQRTPRLTSLYLNMPDDTPEDVEWDLLPNLRQLTLEDIKSIQLSELAELELECFSWSPTPTFSWSPPTGSEGVLAEEMRQIATMTALTQLELCYVWEYKGAEQLQSLHLLQKLVLSKCGNLGRELLEMDAFPVLRELELSKDYRTDDKGYPDVERFYHGGFDYCIPQEAVDLLKETGGFPRDPLSTYVINQMDVDAMRVAMKATAVECMSFVLEKPSMRKISGNATLLELGIPPRPLGWLDSEAGDGSKIWCKM